ncbi:MAG: sensor histidine kinase, partial [Stackebrandtia sp.]
EVLIQALAAAAGIAVENARLYEQTQLRQRWLEASSEIRAELLAGASSDATLHLVAKHAQELSEADCVMILLSSNGGDTGLTVHAAAGANEEGLVGVPVDSAAPVVKEVLDSDASTLVPDIGTALSDDLGDLAVRFGAAVAVPLRTSTAAGGVLMAMRDKGSAPFGSDQPPVLAAFAEQAALALEAAEWQRAQRLLDVLADRDRIAADLHDHVIQRLFACAMNLQGTVQRVSDPAVRRRIEQTVEQLDHTVREIRTSIFNLRTAGESQSGSLRRRLLDAAAEVAGDAGPSPSVRLSGAVDTLVPVEIADHAEAVVREAVSNAVRHARAASITVTAEAGEALILEVVDDGVGIPDDVARSGLAGLEQRATSCEGSFDVKAVPEGGTRLTWRVPLP